MDGESARLVKEGARLYGFEPGTLKLIRPATCSPNDIYSFSKDGRRYILRIAAHDGDHTGQTLAEMEWLSFLAGRGISVSMPLPMSGGALAKTFCGARFYTMCAFEMAWGRAVDRLDSESWNARVICDWGNVMGRMHRAAKDFTPSSPQRTRGRFDGADVLGGALKSYDGLPAIARALVNELTSLPRARDEYGLIHCDFHQHNFVVDEGRVRVFDFDDSLYGPFALDIGIALYHALAWGLSGGMCARQDEAMWIIGHFMRGYLAANALLTRTRRAIFTAMRYRQMSDFAYLAGPERKAMHQEAARLKSGVVIEGCRLNEHTFEADF